MEKYKVFVFLILIIVIMTVIKIKYGYKGEEFKNIIPTVTPTVTLTVKNDYPLQNQLPYQGEGFIIEKYIAPMTLDMKITTASESGAINDVTVWLNSFGDAIGQHKIVLESTVSGQLKK